MQNRLDMIFFVLILQKNQSQNARHFGHSDTEEKRQKTIILIRYFFLF